MFLSELLKWGGRERERESERGEGEEAYIRKMTTQQHIIFLNRRTLTITINC